MNSLRPGALGLALLIAVLAALCSASPRSSPDSDSARGRLVSVSLPVLHISKGERIVGFHFDVVAGRVAQLSDVPIGWDIEIANDPSWNTTVNGSIRVASAALDASFFRHFALLEKEPDADRPFAITGEIDVSTDFASARKIQVTTKDFSIRPDRSANASLRTGTPGSGPP